MCLLRYAPCEHSVLLFTFAFPFQWDLFDQTENLNLVHPECFGRDRGEQSHRHPLWWFFYVLTFLFLDVFYALPWGKLKPEDLSNLAKRCKAFAKAHLPLLLEDLGNSSHSDFDRYVFRQSVDQMHQICQKYHWIVVASKSNRLTVSCKKKCVFFS